MSRRILIFAAMGAMWAGLGAGRGGAQGVPAEKAPGKGKGEAGGALEAREKVGRVRYVRPYGAGDGSGASWKNAARVVDMDEMIERVGPGGTIYVLADAGPHVIKEFAVNIFHGGTAEHPVTIIGVDGNGTPAKARIVGARTRPYPTTEAAFAEMERGTEVFRLNSGASHLRFSFLSFQNVGNGAFYVQGKIADLALEDMDATNVQRFLERGDLMKSSVTGLTVRRVNVEGFSRSVIRLDGETSKVLLEDVTGDSQRQDFDNFAEGIDISGWVHDVVLRRCTMRNSRQSLEPERFWNGDGFTTEKNTHHIVFEDCVASGSTDAGFDLKSSNVTLVRCKSYDNTSNYKLWGKEKVVLRDCISENPLYHGGVQLPHHVTAIGGANVVVESGSFTDRNAKAIVFHTEPNERLRPPLGPTVTVNKAKIHTAGKVAIVDVNSKVTIDGKEQAARGR